MNGTRLRICDGGVMGRARLWIVLVAAAALAACSHGANPQTSSGAPLAAASSTGGATPSSSATLIPNVQTPTQSTFNVTWNPQTKVIDQGTVAHAFRGLASDGSYTFDAASAPSIAALTPGTITVFSGLGLRKIVSVRNDGSQLHVATASVALDQAITNGHIGWQYNIDFGNLAYVAPPGFHRVDVADGPTWFEHLIADPALAEAPVHYEGTIQDWFIDLTLTPERGNLETEIKATKRIDGGTLEVKGSGELDNLTNAVNIDLANGTTTRIAFNDGNLHGNFTLSWNIAFDKAHGGDQIQRFNERSVLKLPLGFSIPLMIGPIPFLIEVKTGFAFAPIFTSKTTVAQGSYHASFGGDVSVENAAASDPGASASLQATGGIDSYGGTMSVAPLGLSVTLMMPKIEFGLGLPEELETGLGAVREEVSHLVNRVTEPEAMESAVGQTGGGAWVALFLQSNFIATGPLAIVPCEKRDLNVIGMVGYEAGLLGVSLTDQSKEVFRKTDTEIVPANIRLCNQK